jgi:hypothetical protein
MAGVVVPAIAPGVGNVEETVIVKELALLVVHELLATTVIFPFAAVQP